MTRRQERALFISSIVLVAASPGLAVLVHQGRVVPQWGLIFPFFITAGNDDGWGLVDCLLYPIVFYLTVRVVVVVTHFPVRLLFGQRVKDVSPETEPTGIAQNIAQTFGVVLAAWIAAIPIFFGYPLAATVALLLCCLGIVLLLYRPRWMLRSTEGSPGRRTGLCLLLACSVPIATYGAVTAYNSHKEQRPQPYTDHSEIPTTLDEALDQLERDLKAGDIAYLRRKGEDAVAESHFGLGMWIRNQWGLWGGSPLAQHFNDMGIQHPDTMSAIIIRSFVRRLRGEDIRLEEQVQSAQSFQRKMEAQQKAMEFQPEHSDQQE